MSEKSAGIIMFDAVRDLKRKGLTIEQIAELSFGACNVLFQDMFEQKKKRFQRAIEEIN